MGEAKRRKQAGTYPDPNDPIAAARRMWCGRDGPGDVRDFRVPEGTVAITFDIDGATPSTCLVNTYEVTDLALAFEKITKMISYYDSVRMLANQFLRARMANEPVPEWIVGVGLWSAFNHPKSGDDMRKAVSRAMGDKGKAHITWRFGPNGLAIALADTFVDMEKLQRDAPKDRVTTAVRPDGDNDDPAIWIADFADIATVPDDVCACFIQIGKKGELTQDMAVKSATAILKASDHHSDAQLALIIDGYDDDPRELWQIEEASEFVRRVITQLVAQRPEASLTDFNFDEGTVALIGICTGAMEAVEYDAVNGKYRVERRRPS